MKQNKKIKKDKIETFGKNRKIQKKEEVLNRGHKLNLFNQSGKSVTFIDLHRFFIIFFFVMGFFNRKRKYKI
jgi:hypothetical protein